MFLQQLTDSLRLPVTSRLCIETVVTDFPTKIEHFHMQKKRNTLSEKTSTEALQFIRRKLDD